MKCKNEAKWSLNKKSLQKKQNFHKTIFPICWKPYAGLHCRLQCTPKFFLQFEHHLSEKHAEFSILNDYLTNLRVPIVNLVFMEDHLKLCLHSI